MKVIAPQAIALVWLCVASPAYACIELVDFKIQDIRKADVVVSGVLTDYEVVAPDSSNSLRNYAILTVQVQRMLKGSAVRTLVLSWDNSTFTEPKGMALGAKVIVAGIRPGSDQPPLRGPSATFFGSPRQDLFRVLQAPCSSAFIFADSRDLQFDLQRFLAGQDLKEVRYSAKQVDLFLSEPIERPIKNYWSGPAGLAGLVVFLSTLVTWLLVRTRSRRKVN